jgi:hypothetical protein
LKGVQFLGTLTVVDGWYDVKDYGAVGDGSHDDTGNINSAIAAIPAIGGVLYFPAGNYKINSGGTTLSQLAAFTTVLGAGTGATIITNYSTTTDILSLPSGANQVFVRDLQLTYNTLPSALSNTTAIRINNTQKAEIQNVYITTSYTGIIIEGGCVGVRLIRVNVGLPANAGQAISIIGGLSSGANNQIHLTDCYFAGVNAGANTPLVGIYIENAQSVFINGCGCINFQYGLQTQPGPSEAVFSMGVVNSSFDSMYLAAMLLGSSDASAKLYKLRFTGSTFTGSSVGVQINPTSGSVCSGICFSGCNIINNSGDGVQLEFCDTVQIVGCSIYGNNTSNTSRVGVRIDNGSHDVVMDGNLMTGGGGSLSASQAYGLLVTSAAGGKLALQNCDLTGNLSGAVSIDPAAAPGCMVQNNPGYNPIGRITVSVPASLTNFQNPNSTSATVYITGSVTAVYIGDSPTAMVLLATVPPAGSGIRIGASQWIKIKYTTAPTWQWFYD